MGLEFSVEFHPSARSLDLSNGGRLDGEMHRVYKFHEVTNNAYPNLRRVDFSVTSTRISAFAREDLAIKNWQDLRKYKIAFNSGRKRTTKILQGLDIEDNLHSVTSEVKAFKMLAADRADVVISSQVQGIKIIKSSAEFSDIKEIALLDEVKLYPYVNKQHTDLIPTLIENLEEMRRDGSYDQILARVNSE